MRYFAKIESLLKILLWTKFFSFMSPVYIYKMKIIIAHHKGFVTIESDNIRISSSTFSILSRLLMGPL